MDRCLYPGSNKLKEVHLRACLGVPDVSHIKLDEGLKNNHSCSKFQQLEISIHYYGPHICAHKIVIRARVYANAYLAVQPLQR